MQLLSGLNNSSVRRLKKAWKGVSEKAKEQMVKLEAVMSHESNFRRYRDLLSSHLKEAQPTIPYLALVLRDVTFIIDGNPDHLPNGNLNFEKMKLLGSHLLELWKLRPYKLHPNLQLKSFYHLPSYDDEKLYIESLLAEAPGGSTIL